MTTDITFTPTDFRRNLKAWLLMARIPFHSVGVLPFCLGAVLAWRSTGAFNWGVFLWGTLAVVLIMLATYLAGEYSDLEEDILSARMERNPFSGGSQAVVRGLVPRRHARIGSYIALALAGAIGLVLQLGYQTGAWTIPLGILGMTAGFFYSTEPVRWVKRGIGEIIIGFSYGWLPIAVAYYLQTGHLSPLVHWMSLPIALSIFNVILINEFPDYPADILQGKKNLTVRIGKRPAAFVYAAAALGGVVIYPLAVTAGLAPTAVLLAVPGAAIALLTAAGMLRRRYEDRQALEMMCACTIVVNLLYAVAYMLGIWLWGV